MKRIVNFFIPIIVFLLVWLYLISVNQNSNVLYAPIFAVVAFGLFSLFDILYGVLTFKECPEAYKQLCNEIEAAKAELKKSGILVDH
jgi:dolichyl-phosphate mannosyltransferase polypeptide 3